ncbi:hypothetical protein [Planktotalea sp.]|uniref:hypothetical protein n=1 Tax=Planktotalea sp. TaxID=2029877 RepID=UPI003D6AB66B
MHRSFISTVVAAALAITSVSASMAQAGDYRTVPRVQQRSGGGNEAVAGVLAGAAALFIIGKAIENNGGFQKRSHKPAPRAHHRPQPPRAHHRPHRNAHRHGGHRPHRAHRGHGSHRFSHMHNRGPRHHRRGH